MGISAALFCFIIIISIMTGWFLAKTTIYRRVEQQNGSLKEFADTMKISETRYRFYQESLDRFSKDMFLVMNSSDIEERLIQELKEILKLDDIYIIEIDDRLNLYRSTGGSADFHETVLQYYEQMVPIGEIVVVDNGCYVKIGENNGRIILLCIENAQNIAEDCAQKIWLRTISRYVGVLYENLFTIKDLAHELERKSQDKNTPRWISRLLFLVAEKERMRLSADLHDFVLQNQILWFRKLESLSSDSDLSPDFKMELKKIEEGILDIIQQIRVTCNDLRPPYLKEQGLIKAMESLFSYTRSHVHYKIEFEYTGLKYPLSEEEMITLYRVTQELLANAQKHSKAAKVEFTISSIDDTVYFHYQDDGVGMDLAQKVDSFEHIGLSGIKQRVDSIEGEMELFSAPGKGVNLLISIPTGNKKLQNRLIYGVFS